MGLLVDWCGISVFILYLVVKVDGSCFLKKTL